MPKITRDQVKVPADVLADVRETYVDNYMKATRGTGRLMLFACDQKVEHLNKDFYGEGIDIAEDRERFDALLEQFHISRPKGMGVQTLPEALHAAQTLGYPVLLRPS